MLIADLFGWSVTPLDVAALGAIVGITAPLTTYLVAIIQRRGERFSRTYEDKKAAYSAVLRDAYNGRLELELYLRILESPGHTNREAEKTIQELKRNYTPNEDYARVTLIALFAPERVLNAHDDYIKVWNKINDAIEVDTDELPLKIADGDHEKIAGQIRSGLEELRKPMTDLRKAINRDVNK